MFYFLISACQAVSIVNGHQERKGERRRGRGRRRLREKQRCPGSSKGKKPGEHLYVSNETPVTGLQSLSKALEPVLCLLPTALHSVPLSFQCTTVGSLRVLSSRMRFSTIIGRVNLGYAGSIQFFPNLLNVFSCIIHKFRHECSLSLKVKSWHIKYHPPLAPLEYSLDLKEKLVLDFKLLDLFLKQYFEAKWVH